MANKYRTKISNEMEKKILEDQRKSPTKNEVIGGHSPNINWSYVNILDTKSQTSLCYTSS